MGAAALHAEDQLKEDLVGAVFLHLEYDILILVEKVNVETLVYRYIVTESRRAGCVDWGYITNFTRKTSDWQRVM